MVSLSAFMRGHKNWDSEDQDKGMKSLQMYLQKCGRLTDQNSIWAAFSYLIQKDSESAKYFAEVIGSHVSKLEDQIKILQQEINALKQ